MSTNPTPAVSPSDSLGIVAELRPVLVKYFRRKTGSAIEAEDLAQDVLLRALMHAGWKSRDQAKGYIFRIAVNCWRDRRRRSRAHGTTVSWDETPVQELGAENPPECVLVVQEELDQIARALEGLNVRTRTVLMLIKLEQMRVATVAEMLGISVSAVNKHLAKGIAHLAQLRKRQDRL